jgi:nickel transport system ATP-binding protein
MEGLLQVENLSVNYICNKREVNILEDVSFSVERGRCLGILGESGSGKSITCKAITGLLDKSFKVNGRALFMSRDLIAETKENIRSLRGSKLCMILQNPMTSFDPLYPMKDQIGETYREHTKLSRRDIKEKMLEGLIAMQIKNPEEVLKKYPHQLSGGMLQRIMISLALSLEPELIIADEPTTAIDSITQYEIMQEFLRIKNGGRTGMIFISHDLGVINMIADDVIVMHKGRIVDKGPTAYILQGAKSPYTQALIKNKRAVMRKFEEILRGAGGARL